MKIQKRSCIDICWRWNRERFESCSVYCEINVVASLLTYAMAM